MRSPSTAALALAAAAAAALWPSGPAQAVPSFAAQTGQPCSACHIGAFGPQLTPFGRAFKIGGYTMQGGDGLASKIPLSGMVLQSFNNTAASLPEGTQQTHYATNNNYALDQVSIFLAGRIADWAGGFVQGTWTNIDNSYHLDQVDLRPYTDTFTIGGKEVRIGFTVNNNPTVQDPWNSTFAWGFPYVVSSLAPAQAATPLLAGGFANNSTGITAYAWIDQSLYLEAGGYQTHSSWWLAREGDDYGPGSTNGIAPYLRASYEWLWGQSSAHVGAMFLQSNVSPVAGGRHTTGDLGHDNYVDLGFDAGYEFVGERDTVSLEGIYIHEDQTLTGTINAANIANGTSFGNGYGLDHMRLSASYWYQNTYGASLAWQKTWGPANPSVYAPGAVTGSANGKPDTNAFILEADWVPFGKQDSFYAPFVNLKLGIQYVLYTQFNGGSSNYDGAGRSASDNNTLYAFAWLAF